MADNKQPFLPVTGGEPTNQPLSSSRSSKKILLAVFGGIFVVCLLLAGGEFDKSGLGSAISSPAAAVSRGKSEGVSEKANIPEHQLLDFPWNNSMLSWQRTAFHFQPEKNWINLITGPLFYKGWYHFFYQYNPNAPVWGDIVWGHAVSRDLIHWLHLPLAMVADQWYDINGVWTGSATILPDGNLVMLYTGSTNESVQVQNLAYPADHADPLLLNWVKYPGNPVLFPPPGIHIKDFRDPTTAWRTPEGKWRITIGSKVNRTGIALVYDTEDFINFDLKDGILHGVPGTGMWECVDFYPVALDGRNGMDTSANGAGVKHVMKTSLDDDRHDYYAIGSYDELNAKWVPDNPEIDVGIGIRYDYGIFYASKTFYDQSKQRRVLWGWIGESDSEAADVRKGWASLQGIPRTVVLDTKTGSNLLQWPVVEAETLRLRSQEFKSSLANDVNKKLYGSHVPVLEGEKYKVRMLVDHSIIESFAQGGRSVITSRVYPTKAIYGAARLFLFNNATEAAVTASIKVWQMNSAFIRPYPNL
ncbi:Acid beta-fructofuranosidase [Linum perenne]